MTSSQLNVLVQLENLMSYPIIHDRVAAGTLRLDGCWFDIASGDVFAYQRTTHSFEVLDRQAADRLLAQLDAVEGADQSKKLQS
jgi:carbonic anhydrase